jgi:predicted Ser/Thr protein kinase
MKTSLEIPDEVVRGLRGLAAKEGRKLKDVVADSLREALARRGFFDQKSIRDIPTISVGQIYPRDAEKEDILGEMLNERGHRY